MEEVVVDYKSCLQWGRSPGKTGSHFHPDSDVFVPSERKDVITSTLCWTAMATILVVLGFVTGPIQLLKLYGVPYWVNMTVNLNLEISLNQTLKG